VTAASERLRALLALNDDLERVANILSWDQETVMPPDGADARAEQRATIERLAHEALVADELAALLEELRDDEAGLEPTSDEASIVRVARRDHEKARRVPAELRAELVREASRGMMAWFEARARSDFSILLPHLERQFELKRRYIDCFEPTGDPYDVLLDDYEEGMTTADVDPVFDVLKRELVPLIDAVRRAEPVDDSCLRGDFPAEQERWLAMHVLEKFGYDPASWRVDLSAHPFASAPSPTDIRITTRFEEVHLGGLFSCMHEFGHGLYERQVSPTLRRTPLATGCSSALHESQSRLWENLVGRGRPFWNHFYPRLQKAFPEQFADVELDVFYRAINKVQPSLIRVDADEVTYNLHIILRYELERELVSGRLALRDLADAFDAKMQEYLGVEPPNAATGVMQDMHWSDGSYGYFPTYSLGNVISVQLWERIRAEISDLDEHIERGDFAVLREWLGEHLHRHGRKFTPAETIERATGSPLDPAPYIRYLKRKVADTSGIAVA
jgi:carboxypeptidase Taq